MKFMKDQTQNALIALLIVLIEIIGFRLVTQAGQPWPLIQNDGYAVSGGLVIFIGGTLLGWLVTRMKLRK